MFFTLQFLISFILIAINYRISTYLKIFDYPDLRKSHNKPTIVTGGLGISLCYASIIFFFDFNEIFNQILIFSFIIMAIGLIDDKKTLNVYLRIFTQGFLIFILIRDINLVIDNLGTYPYVGTINLGSFSELFTIFCIISIINAKNYFDGTHGLTASIFIITIINLVLVVYLKTNLFDESLLILIIPVLTFLLFNLRIFKLPRIFLGDNGSNMLGFILGCLCVYYSTILLEPYEIIWFISLLIFEFVSTSLSRLRRKTGIFKPGKDHLHHLLIEKFSSKIYAVVTIIILNQIFCIAGLLISLISPILSLISFIILFIIYFLIRERYLISKYHKMDFQ